MVHKAVVAIAKTFRGIATAIRARQKIFWGAGVSIFNLAAPVIILSLARKPVDFFTFNPWLSRLPEYLTSGKDPVTKKLAFVSNMALAWFSADNPVEGLEWGFLIDVPSLRGSWSPPWCSGRISPSGPTGEARYGPAGSASERRVLAESQGR